MKKLLTAALMLAATSVQAVTFEQSLLEGASGVSWRPKPPVSQESSWSEIKKALRPEFPQIGFGKTFFSVDALCVDGDKIRPQQPWGTECVEWRQGSHKEEQVCSRTEQVYYSKPLAYTHRVCQQWGGHPENPVCVAWKDVTGQYATSYAIPVRRSTGREDGYEWNEVLFTKRYDVPACK